MYDTHMYKRKSFKVSALMDDLSVRPFLVRLAGSELGDVLVNDFGVNDLEEF